ncbi:hypothetical protein [Sphingomonas sp.]|uniref:hypothetical protein n=1 Tax=Sphingomonas sp. TaxID=28214 RepID=UPI002B79A950|nr:hypothetical protein [Sphingomonas sp.]HTG37331.1 hypothetical protein [Sphingomonas sp.]
MQRPSRFAALSRTRARWTIALLGLLVLMAWQALLTGDRADGVLGSTGDAALYGGIIAAMRGGGGYYEVAADQLRVLDYPVRPFLAFRLPTLAVVQAALPPMLVPVLMLAIALAAGFAWLARLTHGALARPTPLVAAATLLAAGLVAFVQWPLWPFHIFWAAPLVTLSLALRRPGLWLSAVAIGLCAALIRETAALYLVVMAAVAWAEGDRREAGGWLAALGLFALVLGVHAWGASHVAGPLDAQSPGWLGLNGPGLFARFVVEGSALAVVPMAIAAPLVALGAFGWAGWSDPAGKRVAATIGACAVATMFSSSPDASDWAMMAVPLCLVGLVFMPDAVRDLFAAAMDTRRVRVQRISR